ncbi:hypothetical protein ADUPG1_013043 [Aduncisulcus paluster]|uniref:Uncharacterized protein n=1 Tax=Aduncisulcus paluster TaxID=2918883 RepID=A0ABQ5K5S6_9EUKA|nr:hypothetical protein ADUPG1_013043 [Aduncisulcus paluster]
MEKLKKQNKELLCYSIYLQKQCSIAEKKNQELLERIKELEEQLSQKEQKKQIEIKEIKDKQEIPPVESKPEIPNIPKFYVPPHSFSISSRILDIEDQPISHRFPSRATTTNRQTIPSSPPPPYSPLSHSRLPKTKRSSQIQSAGIVVEHYIQPDKIEIDQSPIQMPHSQEPRDFVDIEPSKEEKEVKKEEDEANQGSSHDDLHHHSWKSGSMADSLLSVSMADKMGDSHREDDTIIDLLNR